MSHRTIATVKQRIKRALGLAIKQRAPKRADLLPQRWRLQRDDTGMLARYPDRGA